MEFLQESEVTGLLKAQGVVDVPCEADDERVYLKIDTGGDLVHVHLAIKAGGGAGIDPEVGARVITVEPDRLPGVIESIILKLHLSEVLLVPVGKWRNVFDAVAFSLAGNEEWQAVDAAATVELNRRDPLLCEPGDFHTVAALIKALLSDADDPRQGLMLTTTAAPVLVELIPAVGARLTFGSQVLADEASEAFAG